LVIGWQNQLTRGSISQDSDKLYLQQTKPHHVLNKTMKLLKYVQTSPVPRQEKQHKYVYAPLGATNPLAAAFHGV
jgi:hypothetical protein